MTMSNFNDTQNKQLVNTAIDELKLNPVTDAIPRQVVPTIQPVFELKRKSINVIKNAGLINGTTGTIYTTPSDKDFYLMGSSITYIKDASSTSIYSTVRCTIEDGTLSDVNVIAQLTLTAQQGSNSINYGQEGIKLKRNTAITIQNSAGTANITAYGIIWGYTEETGIQYI